MGNIVFNIPNFLVKRLSPGWTIYYQGDNTFESVGVYTRFEVRYLNEGKVFISGLKYERRRGFSNPEKVTSKSSEISEVDLIAEMKGLIRHVVNTTTVENSRYS